MKFELSTTRLLALLKKEFAQMIRDRSSLSVGLLLPVILILLFGYGLSFDVKNATIAVVSSEDSKLKHEIIARLDASNYIQPTLSTSQQEAKKRLIHHDIDGILIIPDESSEPSSLLLIVNGVDTTLANAIISYINAALATMSKSEIDHQTLVTENSAKIEVSQRMWFNETANSRWYLVPGLLVLVLTLIGAFLSSLLIAREWERGTFEAVFVTPVSTLEIIIAKLLPYLALGGVNLTLCLLASHFLFEVPIRGSLLIIVVAALLYLAVSLLLGLYISAATKNQFQASQIALLTSFLPAMMLSGFVFDLRNVPVVIQIFSQLLPATHFMGSIKSLFLSGNHWPTIFEDLGILFIYGLILLYLTHRKLRKSIE